MGLQHGGLFGFSMCFGPRRARPELHAPLAFGRRDATDQAALRGRPVKRRPGQTVLEGFLGETPVFPEATFRLPGLLD